MKQLFHRVAILLLAVMASGLTGCLFRTQPTLVLLTDPVTARNKMNELVTDRGARQQPASSVAFGHPIGNPRYMIYGLFPGDLVQTLPPITEVELSPYRKGLTRLSARTRSPVLSSLVPARDPARESAALRACADYIERGIRPNEARVLTLEDYMRLHHPGWQISTNQSAPLKQTPDWANPELKLK
jgi:hypothetical protein